MTSNYEILSYRFFNDVLDVVASDEITADANNVLELLFDFHLASIPPATTLSIRTLT